jgi:pilus assembly protein Flp/PilA
MRTFFEMTADFLRSDDGPTATEYAVLIAVICIAVIGAMSGFGGHVGNIYTAIQGTMPTGGGS